MRSQTPCIRAFSPFRKMDYFANCIIKHDPQFWKPACSAISDLQAASLFWLLLELCFVWMTQKFLSRYSSAVLAVILAISIVYLNAQKYGSRAQQFQGDDPWRRYRLPFQSGGQPGCLPLRREARDHHQLRPQGLAQRLLLEVRVDVCGGLVVGLAVDLHGDQRVEAALTEERDAVVAEVVRGSVGRTCLRMSSGREIPGLTSRHSMKLQCTIRCAACAYTFG